MAVYKRDIVDINLETGNIHRSFLKHSIGYKDQKADHFGIRTYRDGVPVDLTGVSVQGIFMPPQGDPIAITSGNIVDGNVAEVVLPQACYNYDGQFTLSIKLVDATNAVTGTMRIVDGMVDNTHASGTVAPTDAVPTYQEILAVYAQLLEDVTDYESVVATQDAKIDDLKSALDEVSIEPELRNGTPQNAGNASAVCTKYVVNYTGFNSVKIVVKKPLKAAGNWYRIAITTYTESGIETNGSNDKQVTISQAYDSVTEVRLYKGMLDSTSVGFAVAIAEKDSGGNNVTLRITDFTPGDFVVVLDNTMLDLVTGKVNALRDGAINGIEATRGLIGQKIQFLPQKTAWSTGYWNNDKTIHSGSSYRCYAIYGFSAGTYYLNNFEEWQSYIENIETGAIQAVHYVKESADTGYKFTVNYPFNIFISSSQINSESMFANNVLPVQYIYGVYPKKSEQHIIYVEKDGSGDFTSLVDAINFATQYMDSIVYVGSGTWDIIDELGSAYVESVSDTKRGLVLKNRIHVIFASNSKVTCNYTGSRSTTKQWLSAFNSGEYGFTLENARIYSDNVRYTIHDERDQDTDAYRNEYKNCKMVHSNGYYGQCIGGGLGTDGEVIIEDCYFNNTTTEGWREVVSYHNTAGSGRSFVDVHGCYFEGNHGVRFSWYGESPETDKSTMLVHGNSFGRENGTINNSAEGGATIENTEIIAYNNEFRN